MWNVILSINLLILFYALINIMCIISLLDIKIGSTGCLNNKNILLIFLLFKNVFIKNLVINIKINKFLFIFSVFLILMIFIGGASAASDENTTLSQSID